MSFRSRQIHVRISSLIGVSVVVLFVLAAILAPILTVEDPNAIDLGRRLDPPFEGSLLGRDELGRDVFSRMLHGARFTFTVVALSISLSGVMGTLLGTISGYRGGLVDEITMRGVDILLSFPRILLAIFLVGVIGPSFTSLTVALCVPDIPRFARVARGSVLTVRQNEFVEAAKAIGENGLSIVFRYILPNAIAPVVVYGALATATGILTVSSLSFLGLGMPPPTAEWGSMIAAGREYLRIAPHLVLIPGLAIMVIVLSLNLLGDDLRDSLDPRMRGTQG